MSVQYVAFKSDLSEEYYFHGGMLFINASLSEERKLEIIKEYMRED